MKILTPAGLLRFGFKLAFFLAPVALLGASFFMSDPFKIFHRYQSFYGDGPPFIALSRAYVAAEMYLKRLPEKPYDSIIFGNSRSLAFLTKDWKSYLDKAATVFHFDGAGESLFGVWATLKLIDRLDAPLKNALFVVDTALLKQTVEKMNPLGIHHPQVSEISKWKFYSCFFKAYLTRNFCISYWDMKIFKTCRPYMKSYFSCYDPFSYDPMTNDLVFSKKEMLISKDSESYYADKSIFYPRVTDRKVPEMPSVINENQKKMLREIMLILVKRGTDFKIVVSPMYDQRKINSEDLRILQEVFGLERVYDYSGVNALTNNIRNYYEPHHYRPQVAQLIMKDIYSVGKRGGKPSYENS